MRRSLVCLSGWLVLAHAAACLAAIVAAEVTSTTGALYELSNDPADVVLIYRHVLAVRDEDPGPSMTLHGDGRVRVHVPHYMKNAGDYELRLAPGETTALVGAIVDAGVVEFDPAAVRRACRSIDVERAKEGKLAAIIEESSTVIELHLERYTPAGTSGTVERNLSKTVRWSGIAAHARQYPEVGPLQALAGVAAQLEAIMTREDRARVEVAR
jgi:hypothetical protein